jgi:hypothetical protein
VEFRFCGILLVTIVWSQVGFDLINFQNIIYVKMGFAQSGLGLICSSKFLLHFDSGPWTFLILSGLGVLQVALEFCM